jgi:hypothetical protein
LRSLAAPSQVQPVFTIVLAHSSHCLSLNQPSNGIAMPTTTPMRVNSIPWWLWLVPFALLLMATEKMPYGYYTLTGIIVCGFASCLVFVGWEDKVVSRIWSVVFGCIAVLFNPIIPIYLSRRTWFGLDDHSQCGGSPNILRITLSASASKHRPWLSKILCGCHEWIFPIAAFAFCRWKTSGSRIPKKI